MTYELNMNDYLSSTGRLIKDVLEKDKGRLESRLKFVVEKEAQNYLAGVSIAIIEKLSAEDPMDSKIILKITTPD